MYTKVHLRANGCYPRTATGSMRDGSWGLKGKEVDVRRKEEEEEEEGVVSPCWGLKEMGMELRKKGKEEASRNQQKEKGGGSRDEEEEEEQPQSEPVEIDKRRRKEAIELGME